jgi:hypothetical protein
MKSTVFYDTCPKCGSSVFTVADREYEVRTTSYRKISYTMLIEKVKCESCGLMWCDYYEFINGHRGDWMFASPIVKCPVCGGDNFEMERSGRGTKTGQNLSFRCIEDDDFTWGEVYSFLYAQVRDDGDN